MQTTLLPGGPWLSEAEARQVARIVAMRDIFSGKHREYFYQQNNTQHAFKAVGPNMAKVLYICDNLPGMCTLKHADLLFGEELVVEPDTNDPDVADAIKRISTNSQLHPLLYELAVTTGWAGKSYLQLVIENGDVRLENVAPENVFPRYAPGTNRLIGATIKLLLEISGKRYLRVIDHSVGHITHHLYELEKRGRIACQAPLDLVSPGLPPVQETGIDALTVIESCNFTPGGRGASDYDGAESLVDEINNRLTQISRILDQHGDPAVVALEDLFDEHGNLKISGRAIRASTMDKGMPVQYLTWDAKLDYCASQLDRAIHAFLRGMEIAPPLIGLGGGTSADSWKKYKLQVGQTLARVNRKQLFMTPAIQAAFRVAMALENRFVIGASYPVTDVILTYSDGLPVDDLDLMQITTGYHSAGLMSTERALTWIHSDPAIVADELEKIAAEQDAKLPTAFRDGMMGLAGNE